MYIFPRFLLLFFVDIIFFFFSFFFFYNLINLFIFLFSVEFIISHLLSNNDVSPLRSYNANNKKKSIAREGLRAVNDML